MIKVPFADLYAQYISIKGSIDKAIEKTIASSSYIGGKDIPAFEVAFPAYLQMKHVMLENFMNEFKHEDQKEK